jgi:hypothetical protein
MLEFRTKKIKMQNGCAQSISSFVVPKRSEENACLIVWGMFVLSNRKIRKSGKNSRFLLVKNDVIMCLMTSLVEKKNDVIFSTFNERSLYGF